MLTRLSQLTAGQWSQPPDPALNGPTTLVLAFSASSALDDPADVESVVRLFPDSVVVGCSTAGEILAGTVSDETVTVAVTRFDHTQLRAANSPLSAAADSYRCGTELASELAGEELRAVLVLAPGLEVNGSDLVRGLSEPLPHGVLITGGLAGDGDRFGATWVLADGQPPEGMATAVGFYGDRIRLGHGSRGGWVGFGPERTVTRSDGNVLLELDGKPALSLYRQYLGELAADLPASGLRFPLAVRESDTTERSLVRTLLAVDDDEMSMTFAGDVPQGWFAQLMGASSDQLLDGAEGAAQAIDPRGECGPMLAVAISCVGRRMLMGENVDEEVERISVELPAGSVQVGFYSFGELSPSATGVCELHNQTMTLTTFTEV
ncbi:FIST signal transduction protein [Methanothrix soehngenii]|uniref:FIST signal transduction protein n=1 Tax=Methanothrix soehngenii TaxID=2223 RepID=UPI00300D77BA